MNTEIERAVLDDIKQVMAEREDRFGELSEKDREAYLQRMAGDVRHADTLEQLTRELEEAQDALAELEDSLMDQAASVLEDLYEDLDVFEAEE